MSFCRWGCLTLCDGIFFTVHKINVGPHHTRRTTYLFKSVGSKISKICGPLHMLWLLPYLLPFILNCPHGDCTVLTSSWVKTVASYLGASMFKLGFFLMHIIPCSQTRNNSWNWLHSAKLTRGNQPTFRRYMFYVILAHALKAYGGQSTVALINLSTRWGELSTAALAVRKRSRLRSHVESRTWMDFLMYRKILCAYQQWEIVRRSSKLQLSNRTDYATATPLNDRYDWTLVVK
jgi:hypothetical protein